MSSCTFCEREAHESEKVSVTSNWSVGPATNRGVPGWFYIWSTRHVIGFDSLSEEAAGEFGFVLARVMVAAKSATDTAKAYFAIFGDKEAHLHGLLLTRPTELPFERSGPSLLTSFEDLRDDVRAAAVAEAVSRELSRDRLAPVRLAKLAHVRLSDVSVPRP